MHFVRIAILVLMMVLLLLVAQANAAGYKTFYYKKNPSFAIYPHSRPGLHATIRHPGYKSITTGHKFRAIQRVDHRSHLYHKSRTNGIINNHARLRQTSPRTHGYSKILPNYHYGVRSF